MRGKGLKVGLDPNPRRVSLSALFYSTWLLGGDGRLTQTTAARVLAGKRSTCSRQRLQLGGSGRLLRKVFASALSF